MFLGPQLSFQQLHFPFESVAKAFRRFQLFWRGMSLELFVEPSHVAVILIRDVK